MQWDLLWPLIDDKTEGGAVLCWGLLPFTHQLALQIRAWQKEEQNEVWNQFEYLNVCEVCNLGEKMTLKFWWKAKSDNDKKIQRESNGNWPVEAATAALAPDYYCDLISRGGGMVLGWIVKQATASVLHTFAILFPGLTIVLLWASEQ